MTAATEIKIPRIARAPIAVPAGVEVKLDGQNVDVKGPKGALQMVVHPNVSVEQGDGEVRLAPTDQTARALSGTMRALLANMVQGVTQGFEKKLELIGVGYRAQAKGKTLNLQLGFSHPVEFPVPEGITIDTPDQTHITVSGIDKQLVGQVAAKIRDYRPPEPYKGKGVRYAGEYVLRKEAKKK